MTRYRVAAIKFHKIEDQEEPCRSFEAIYETDDADHALELGLELEEEHDDVLLFTIEEDGSVH